MKNLLNPEYATSDDRIRELRKIVIEDKDAESVVKYAEQFLAYVEDSVLRTLSNPKGNSERAAIFLQTANSFVKFVKGKAELAKRKEKVLIDLEKEKRED